MTTKCPACGETFTTAASGPAAKANVAAQLDQHRRSACPAAKETK